MTMLKSYVLFLLSSIAANALPDQQIPLREPPQLICPLPVCKTCPSVAELRAPGVGIALELGYGTAVIRHHDGSYDNIAQIQGTEAYTALMQRLATGPQQRGPGRFEDLNDNWERLRFIGQRAQRQLNKAIGLPATRDIGIMAVMVEELIAAVSESTSVQGMVISSPDRIRLTYEELGDLFNYLKVKDCITEDQPHFDMSGRLFSLSAAYAGSGFGMCSSYFDAARCWREKQSLPESNLLHLDFSHNALSGGVRTINSAFDTSLTDRAFIDSQLGSNQSDTEDFWLAITNRIRDFTKSFPEPITQLILTGPSACNSKFRSIVRNALQDLATNASSLQLGSHCSDTIFITARGAAELAKRRQEGPHGCRDSEECAERRASQRSSTPKLVMQDA